MSHQMKDHPKFLNSSKWQSLNENQNPPSFKHHMPSGLVL